MSYLLSEPRTVLVVDADGEIADRVEAATVPDVATTVVSEPRLDDALDALDERDGVGCVVVTAGGDASPAAAADAVREREGLVPVVAVAPSEGCDHGSLAAVPDCRFLPERADDDALRAAVENALETYDERRRREAESSLFTTLLDEGELAIFAKDREGRHLYKADLEDDAAPESVVGKTDLDITPDYLMDQAREDYADDLRVVETGEPIRDKVGGYSHDGYEHWSETTKIPWRDDSGDVRGLVGYAENISDRKRYERLLGEQADRIDQFISYVAHDLRTPLQVVYGHIHRAKEGDEDALEEVEDGVRRIEDIVDDLSALSKQDDPSGISSKALRSLTADSITTELVPVIENVWSLLSTDEATLRVDLPPGTLVAADTETLRPLVENLLKNALDHAGPDVTVRVGALDRGFFVEDDGPGVPEDSREDVFEDGYTSAADGTGTGLAIVSKTVEQQGWEVDVADASTDWLAGLDGHDPVVSPGARFEISGVPMVTRRGFDVEPAREVALDGNRDVGPVSIPGSADYDSESDAWTVVANGSNVWANIHEFHYVHGRADAPVRIEARIDPIDGPEDFSKAGIAVRANDDELAPFGYVGTTASHGSEVTWREAADGFTDSDQFDELPGTFSRYRLEYVDGVVTCYLSESGTEWMAVDQQALDLGERVSVGLMVCSHSSKRTCEATFRGVRVHELDTE